MLGDPVAARDAIYALRRYFLVTPTGDVLVLVHRLVQTITRAQLPAQSAVHLKQAAAALVEEGVPVDPKLPATWLAYALLLPHTQAVLDLTSPGISKIAEYLGWSGSYPAARDQLQLIFDAHQASDAYGPEHPDTLTASSRLAYWTGEAGDAAGPATSSPRCCPSASASWAPSTPIP